MTVIVAIQGDRAAIARTLESVLGQSYPFMELLLLYSEDEKEHAVLARKFSGVRSHVAVRIIRVPFRLDSEPDRIRAMEQGQTGIHGAWILVVDSDVVLEPHAIESALAFAHDKDLTALGLTPGVECRSLAQRLVAPSLEWFVRMMRVVDRGREQSSRIHPVAAFMLFHADTHSIVNRMNRMPGILNESGWTLWSYRLEGLRTFQGDGSGWIFRDATPRSLLSEAQPAQNGRRTQAFLVGSAAIALVSVFGVVFGLMGQADSLVTHGILYLSAFSYSLMSTSYFFYSRRLRAATWFAPFWFMAHAWALLVVVMELRRSSPSDRGAGVVPGRVSGPEFSARK